MNTRKGKDKQTNNGQQNTTQKTKEWATWMSGKQGWARCSWRISSSCSTFDTRNWFKCYVKSWKKKDRYERLSYIVNHLLWWVNPVKKRNVEQKKMGLDKRETWWLPMNRHNPTTLFVSSQSQDLYFHRPKPWSMIFLSTFVFVIGCFCFWKFEVVERRVWLCCGLLFC
jgi:hypothetical protein